jgi:glycosyltransferase involved in cell wall biosynthesis
MKRVLFCRSTHSTWGGTERWMDTLTEHLARSGWDVAVALARGRTHNDPERYRRLHPGTRAVEIDGRTGTPEGRVRAVCRAVRAFRPDIVVPLELAEVLPAVGRLKRRGMSVRLVQAVHATILDQLHELREYAPIIDLAVGVNPLQAAFLDGWANLPADRLGVILCGTELPDRPAPCEARSEEPLRLLFVGRLHPEHKRVLDAVPLVEELKRRQVPFRLSFVGSGPAEATLREHLRHEEARDQVRFYGYLPPERIHAEVYPEHDALVLFSPSEGCPLAVQEGMGHGVIPLCSDFLGVYSLPFLRPGETCFVYPLGDVCRLADAVENLSADPLLRGRMAAACLAEARGMTLDRCHRLWERAFRRVLELPVRGLREDVVCFGVRPIRGHSRLERLGLTPGMADLLRRGLRRWPEHPSGFAEWPATILPPDEATRAAMQQELYRLDRQAATPPLCPTTGGNAP